VKDSPFLLRSTRCFRAPCSAWISPIDTFKHVAELGGGNGDHTVDWRGPDEPGIMWQPPPHDCGAKRWGHYLTGMPDSELTKLRRARSRAHKCLKLAEAQVTAYQAKVADIEARIQAISPELKLPVRYRAPNPHFAKGELTRLVLDILRVEDAALPVGVVAVLALKRKGVMLPGPTLRKDVRRRLRGIFVTLGKRGMTVKVSRGNATRRGLAH
jgi:hypothetical protein